MRLGIVGARVGGPFALLIRRQTRLSRGVKDILVTGITVTTLFSSVATASAQNIFEALFGRLAPPRCIVSTARTSPDGSDMRFRRVASG